MPALHSPAHWLQQAEDIDAIARRTQNAELRRTLLTNAVAYCRLARRAAATDAADQKPDDDVED